MEKTGGISFFFRKFARLFIESIISATISALALITMEIVITIILCLSIAIVFVVVRRKTPAVEIQDAAPFSPDYMDIKSVPPVTVPESQQPEIVSPQPEAKKPEVLPEKPEVQSATDLVEDDDEQPVTQNEDLVAGLHKVFEEDKVFLQPDIHIDDVARMLMTNRTYITRLMRQEYGLSFIEYVNVARVQYSQQLLYTYDLTLDEVAEKSGFLSASNYCRVFKRIVGSSPNIWIQHVKRKH